MLLYELAVELGQRSPDLADAARELGLGELGPASELDAAQVAALRSRFGPAVSAAVDGGLRAPADWGPPPAPPPAAPSSGPGFSRGQLVAIGAVVLAVVALFAFMALSTGGSPDDDASETDLATEVDALADPADLAAISGEAADDPTSTAAAAVTTAPATTAPPTAAPAAAEGEPTDLGQYCQGARQVASFLTQLGQFSRNGSTATFADTQALVGEHRAAVAEGMDLVQTYGPSGSKADAATVADGLDGMLTAVVESADEMDFVARYPESRSEGMTEALDVLVPEWESYCS